ncbi:hypothetical protein MLD38_010049 [Melastoma candidum]|uniref:Uncharacterized protein n=1 Tax=Melastoma candidum TaxID=119954 RepID=A0ACB9QYK9_9MYRT|nr:hypothetical protein MLD38_010049 [Melastoma candidum]
MAAMVIFSYSDERFLLGARGGDGVEVEWKRAVHPVTGSIWPGGVAGVATLAIGHPFDTVKVTLPTRVL